MPVTSLIILPKCCYVDRLKHSVNSSPSSLSRITEAGSILEQADALGRDSYFCCRKRPLRDPKKKEVAFVMIIFYEINWPRNQFEECFPLPISELTLSSKNSFWVCITKSGGAHPLYLEHPDMITRCGDCLEQWCPQCRETNQRTCCWMTHKRIQRQWRFLWGFFPRKESARYQTWTPGGKISKRPKQHAWPLTTLNHQVLSPPPPPDSVETFEPYLISVINPCGDVSGQ